MSDGRIRIVFRFFPPIVDRPFAHPRVDCCFCDSQPASFDLRFWRIRPNAERERLLLDTSCQVHESSFRSGVELSLLLLVLPANMTPCIFLLTNLLVSCKLYTWLISRHFKAQYYTLVY